MLHGEGKEVPESGGAPVAEAEAAWRCARCGHTIALDRDRIPLDGAATRAFVNPAGIEFVIAGFREASGCALQGEPSTYWSWFAGFRWTAAACAACGAHLGWHFDGPAHAFFGLIVDRLARP